MKNLTLKHYTTLMLVVALTIIFGYRNANATPKAKGRESVTSSLKSAVKAEKVILIVLSAKNKLEMNNKTTIKVGYFLDELAVPAQAFIAAGYKIEVATPDGIVPAMDETSGDVVYFRNDKAELDKALKFVRTNVSLNHPFKLSAVANSALKKYSAIFIPGGRAPLTDLMQSRDLGKILRYAHQNNTITSLICHGPIALAAALDNPEGYRKALASNDKAQIAQLAKNWIYAGYDMTIFTNSEEDEALKGSVAKLQFYVADALQYAGGKIKRGKENWKSFVVKDRELITGQNPGSDHELAEKVLEVLKERSK